MTLIEQEIQRDETRSYMNICMVFTDVQKSFDTLEHSNNGVVGRRKNR